MLANVMPLVGVLAEGEAAGGTVDVGQILTTAANGANTQINSAITTVVPIALTLLGIVLAIRIGVSVYKRLSTSASK